MEVDIESDLVEIGGGCSADSNLGLECGCSASQGRNAKRRGSRGT